MPAAAAAAATATTAAAAIAAESVATEASNGLKDAADLLLVSCCSFYCSCYPGSYS